MSSFLGFPLRHIPALFIGSAVTLGCTPAYFDIPAGARAFGLPTHIATSPAAYSPWLLFTNRMQAIGGLILLFYSRGDYAAVDTVLASIGFHAFADVYVYMREGWPKIAILRIALSVLVAGWGLAGMTSGPSI